MKCHNLINVAATTLLIALSQGAVAQSYAPAKRIVKPNILPKPVANRLIKRPDYEKRQQTPKAKR